MKIALLQLNPLVGDIVANSHAILFAAKRAKAAGAELCITPELALVGYPPRDFLLYEAFLAQAEKALEFLAAQLANGPALVLGTVGSNEAPHGKPLYNQAVFLDAGRIVARYSKQLLPSYDVFEENRYFEPGSDPVVVEWNGRRIALTVCEDIWNDSAFWPDRNYPGDPVAASVPFDLLINLSASPFTQGKHQLREAMLSSLATRYNAELLYVNQVGGNDELVFDGRSMRITPDGSISHRALAFAEDVLMIAEDETSGRIAEDDFSPESEIWRALVLGIRDYVHKSGMDSTVLGLSGGVDSALVAALACEALGAEHVLGVLMPSPWSSDHSIADAKALAKNLGMRTVTIPIEPAMRAFDTMLAPSFEGLAPGVAEENIQARIRGIILMAYSNKLGSMLLTTGNKSEISVGYCTIYGDMCGGLAPIADLSKIQVYRLCEWYNSLHNHEIIPNHILTKAPSAELRPGQTDQDSLPPYDELDSILRLMLEERLPAERICKAGHAPETVRKIAGLAGRSEFKRHQAAPGLKITAQAFGVGWRMPVAAKAPYLIENPSKVE